MTREKAGLTVEQIAVALKAKMGNVTEAAMAGIPLAYMEGQIVGKLWMTLAALPVIHLIRQWDVRRGLTPARSRPAGL